jgi:hypothetical protein
MPAMSTNSRRPTSLHAAFGATCLALAFALSACGGAPSSASAPERKMAQLDGDPTTQAEFGRLLDTMQSGGTHCKPDPIRQHAADLIVAAYTKAGAHGTLLDFATLIVGACG